MERRPTYEKLERRIYDLVPGDHLCWVYETEEEHRAWLVPFIRKGLEHGEKVIYILNSHSAEEILNYFYDNGTETELYLESGQLVVFSADEAYVQQQIFDPDDMIAFLKDQTEQALKEGYSALRVTGEMTWILRELPGSERLIEYEAKLNEFFPNSKCLAICQYSKSRFAPEILLAVLNTHPIAGIGIEVFDNFYYLPPEDYFGPGTAAKMLKNQLATLLTQAQAKESLLRSRREFRLIAENVPGLFSYVDAHGHYRFVNKHYEEWFGLPSNEIVGKHYREVLGEATYELIKDRVNAALSGQRVRYEDALPYNHGGTRWVLVQYVPDINDGGRVNGFFSLVTDITYRE